MAAASTRRNGGLLRHLQLLSSASLHPSSCTGKRFTKKVVGPAFSNSRATLSLIPLMAADITTTTKTPMAMPRIVSAARTLLARRASIAMRIPSRRDVSRSPSPIVIPAGGRRSDRGARRGWPGRRPEMIPTPAPTDTARITDQSATLAGSGDTDAISFASAAPAATPKPAPMMASVVDSARNWRMMSRRLAPSALRTPISRVRSATATSMMFMITIEPTISPIAGSAMPARTRYPWILRQNASAESCVCSEKSSGTPGRRRCRIRITWRAISITPTISCSLAAWTVMPPMDLEAVHQPVHGGLVGHDDELVHRDPEGTPLFVGDADHRVRQVADPELAPDGGDGGEEVLADLLADDHHRASRARIPAATGGAPPARPCS